MTGKKPGLPIPLKAFLFGFILLLGLPGIALLRPTFDEGWLPLATILVALVLIGAALIALARTR
jgi:hypothetical protein